MKLKVLATILIVITISNISVNAFGINLDNKQTSENTVFINSEWKQINEDGFGNKHNYGPRGITIFNDTLIIGTDNIVDYWTQLYSGMPVKDLLKFYIKLRTWEFQSDGCEIWSYERCVKILNRRSIISRSVLIYMNYNMIKKYSEGNIFLLKKL